MDILRYEETRREELYQLDIYGLRLGEVNEDTTFPEDPMTTFLREVLTALPCAAHMSHDPWQHDLYDFSALYAPERFVPTRVGVYTHLCLFVGDDRPYGVFFPHFFPDDLNVLDKRGGPLIEDLLTLDQPMLYLKTSGQSTDKLQALFTNPPAETEQFVLDWFRAATEIVPVVLAGGHDESCYHAISRSPEHFALLEKPLQRTEQAIRESTWFQENADVLQWSDDTFEWCLVLPCGDYEGHRRCE